ncbi:MAG: PAS domain S-box protein [Deltaproteobacteria bacterium]|nr:PAS domain S-box protein [Deltaproteobacteria bacterium]
MSKPSEGQPDRSEMRTKIMGLGERAGRKSFYPQLQARIRELEEHKVHLEEKSAALSNMLQELDGACRRAEEGEKRFRELAELLPQTVFETDLAGRATFVNRFAFEMFGYTPSDFQQGLNALDLLVPGERDRVRADMSRRLQGEDLPGQQYTALRKDGSTFPCIIYTTVIRDDAGIKGFRGIVVDITEPVRLREQKDSIEEQYHQAQKMEAIGRLAGGVAHDLNNLLCPILGYAEMLLDQFSPEDERHHSVEEIHRAGLRARDLVRQLLAFSRKQALEIKVVDLNRAISSFETLLRRMLREDIEVRTKLSPSRTTVLADVGQIEQVIMNLAVNAQDAMPDGGRISIETEIAELDETYTAEHHGVQPGPYILLAMSDTGQGMDAETREHIFDPFFTTKEKGKGTGLGLATVYGIVKQHGGSIWVYSEPGKGSTFKIFLPSAQAAVTDSITPLAMPKNGRGTETILLAEDSEMVRNLTVHILERQGYTLISGSNGTECLRLLADHDGPLDLLITDVVMPDMNGKMLFERVATRCPGIKVLYMSGYTDDVIVQHGILDEGIAFIQKPFTVQSLVAKVREVLD